MLQLSGRALSASSLDGELFVDRSAELAALERARRLGFNVYLMGPPGAGATSLLHRVEARAEAAVFVGAASVTTFEALVSRLAAAVARAGGSTAADPWGPVVRGAGDPLLELRAAVAEADGPTPLTLLVDDLDERLRDELFGRQRDELWELPLRWVVTGRSPLAPPADAFFELQLPLPPLEVADQVALLQRRAGGGGPREQTLVERLATTLPSMLGPSQPRALLTAARGVVAAVDPDAALDRLQQQLDDRAARTGPEERLLAALDALGPTWAGDERLLREVGTTRSRVVQLLRTLEADGLVTATRQGRRVLYAPATRQAGTAA